MGENNTSIEEAVRDLEQKHRKRGGGLGDVYQDKCTEGSTKIVWDENAIARLLDRSILQSGSTDLAEGDLENDMLGSVKVRYYASINIQSLDGTVCVFLPSFLFLCGHVVHSCIYFYFSFIIQFSYFLLEK